MAFYDFSYRDWFWAFQNFVTFSSSKFSGRSNCILFYTTYSQISWLGLSAKSEKRAWNLPFRVLGQKLPRKIISVEGPSQLNNAVSTKFPFHPVS